MCPGYTLTLSETKWETKDPTQLRVDGALHADADAPKDGRPHWETVRLLLEYKGPGRQRDAYDDGAGEAGEDVRGQAGTYVQHVFDRQHRTALFFFLIFGTKLRVTYWDHSGTIYTSDFDYTEHPETLRDVLYGFSLLSDAKQGLDKTATRLRPSDAEYKLMDAVARPVSSDVSQAEGTIIPDASTKDHIVFAEVRKEFADSIASSWPRYKVTVPSQDGGKAKEFLIGEPIFLAPGVVGRGTRGYIAYEKRTKRFKFLKDTWRPFCERVDAEGVILGKLHGVNVPNIPTLYCCGDLGQRTVSPNYAKPKPQAGRVPRTKAEKKLRTITNKQPLVSESVPGTKHGRGDEKAEAPKAEALRAGDAPANPQLREMTHYRMVVEEVCLPMSKFKTGKQLVSIIRDCVIGMVHSSSPSDSSCS